MHPSSCLETDRRWTLTYRSCTYYLCTYWKTCNTVCTLIYVSVYNTEISYQYHTVVWGVVVPTATWWFSWFPQQLRWFSCWRDAEALGPIFVSRQEFELSFKNPKYFKLFLKAQKYIFTANLCVRMGSCGVLAPKGPGHSPDHMLT